jgi:hypothetical protein
MKPDELNLPLAKVSLEPPRVSGRGCRHCESRVEHLRTEETCPETFRCPVWKARWIFARHVEMDRDDFLASQRSLDEPFCCKCGKCRPEDAQYAGLVFVSLK